MFWIFILILAIVAFSMASGANQTPRTVRQKNYKKGATYKDFKKTLNTVKTTGKLPVIKEPKKQGRK